MPGVLKIGATRRDPNERLAEANASDTWRPPRPYVVACATEVAEGADAFACERAIHALLAARRVNTRHEFFEVTPLEARVLFSLLVPVPVPPGDAPVPLDAMRNEINEINELGELGELGERIETQAMFVADPAAFTGFRRETSRLQHRQRLQSTLDTRARRCVGEAVPSEVVTSEVKLRAWVEGHYVHVPLREKDTGTKLEALYGAYFSAAPPVHTKPLGRNKFAAMLSAVFPNIGPHRNKESTIKSLYLVR
jgi:hypothetical protein